MPIIYIQILRLCFIRIWGTAGFRPWSLSHQQESAFIDGLNVKNIGAKELAEERDVCPTLPKIRSCYPPSIRL